VGPFDVVVFTGDLTQRGRADEFKRLENTFLVDLWNVVGGPDTVLLAVPLARLGVSVDGDLALAVERLEGWPDWNRIEASESYFEDPFGIVLHESDLHFIHHLLSMTTETGLHLGDVVTNLAHIGLVDAVTADRVRGLGAAISLKRDDGPLVDAVPWERYSKQEGTDLNRIWFDWARFKLWERPETELRDRIAVLVCLFEAADL
jgi:hypothetical protein